MSQFTFNFRTPAVNAPETSSRERVPAFGIADPGGVYLASSDAEVLRRARAIIGEMTPRGQVMSSPNDAQEFVQMKLAGLEHEVFAVLFLDSQCGLIAYEEPFAGTIDQAIVYPREIAKLALQHNAKCVIVAHNHPSRCAEASQADIRVTRELRQTLALIEVRLMDHLIVAGQKVVSMAGQGLM